METSPTGGRTGSKPIPDRTEPFPKSFERKVEENVKEREKPPVQVDQEVIPSSRQETEALEVYQEERYVEESKEVSEEIWRGLVDFTRARNPILGSFLVLGNPIRFSDGRVEIGFEKDSFHYDRILEKGNQNLLELICQEYFKKKTKIVISPLEKGTRLQGKIINPGEEQRKKPEEEGKNHPEANSVVQEALRLFDGRIVEK